LPSQGIVIVVQQDQVNVALLDGFEGIVCKLVMINTSAIGIMNNMASPPLSRMRTRNLVYQFKDGLHDSILRSLPVSSGIAFKIRGIFFFLYFIESLQDDDPSLINNG
jgi:hypothetical protein